MEQQSSGNNWNSDSGYIWSMIGSAVGFANILGFSSRCYLNGGGAFLVPFFIALIVLGLPLLQLEGVIGQRFSLPLVSVYGRVAGNKAKVFGWLSVLACLTIGAFYTVLTGWSVAYTYFSGFGMISDDSAKFFTHTFLKDSGGLTNIGDVSIYALVFTLVVMVFSWYVISKNIQSGIERVCTIFLPMLSVLVAAFAIAVIFLPGASEGFRLYLTPDYSKLWNARLWLESFGHVFFSLSLGLGIVTGYSRHTGQSTSIPRAMLLVALGDTLISVISGFAIFGAIGYMSQASGVPFNEVANPHSIFEIGFVAFPAILKTFGPLLSRLLGAIFFFCVFIAGVTGVFSIVESIAGNIEIEFSQTRKMAVTIAIIIMSAMSVFFCMGNGTYIIEALEPMVLGFNMLLGGIAEIVAFIYFSSIISGDTIWQKGSDRKTIAYLSLKYVVIFLLLAILMFSFKQEIDSGFGIREIIRWGWFVAATAMAILLAKYARPTHRLT